MITQRDSRVMMEIGEATKSDSAAMKTVAVVTMAFLPATCACVSSLNVLMLHVLTATGAL